MSRSGLSHHRPHVLIVSDDVDLGGFLAEGLVYGGFWTSSIASGIQTLEVFRLRSFDLILIDAGLSDLSAIEVIRRLRGQSNRVTTGSRRIDIPIVVIASSAAEAESVVTSSIEIDEIRVAPIDLEDLVPDLHGLVERWRVQHPEREWADTVAQRTTPNEPVDAD